MEKNRYNTFNLIHKGLRGFLYNTGLVLQQADLSDPEQSWVVVRQVEEVVSVFDKHALNEDKFLLPAVTEHSAMVAASFENEHAEDHRLGENLKASIAAWQKATSIEERLTEGRKIFYAFNEFIAFNLYHMNKEETLLNKVLWESYRDDEIRLFEQAILRNTPPEMIAVTGKWIMRSISDAEIVRWVSEIKRHAPHLFEALQSLGKNELPAVRWEAVMVEVERN